MLVVFVIALTFSSVQSNDVKFFYNDKLTYVGCMKLCQKLGRRSPSVTTLQDWRKMEWTLELLEDSSPFPETFYLSVTRGGGVNGEGSNSPDILPLDHWPKEIRDTNEWRDYYTGEKLEDFNQTWNSVVVPQYCAAATRLEPGGEPDLKWEWQHMPCSWMIPSTPDLPQLAPWCACKPQDPDRKLLLRGTCSSSHLRGVGADVYYKPDQLLSSLDKIFFASESGWYAFAPDGSYTPTMSTRLDYNVTSSRWTHSGKHFQTTAFSLARNETYLLGKYNWTVSNDHQQCHLEKGKANNETYTAELKLSGCNQGFTFDDWGGKMVLDVGEPDNAEFTCNDGQCVSMESRCDQWPDCDDGSDEKGCRLFSLAEGYNKVVPPYVKENSKKRLIAPVPIDVSINLLKMMGIDERENTIDLQFDIILEWKDHRITYNNLKTDVSLNALTDTEKETVWLPIVIYANTDQKETTRLGWIEEWSTSVVVSRDGNLTR